MNFFNIIKSIIRFYLMILPGLLELMYDVAAYLFSWYADDEKKIDDIAVGLTLGFLILTAVVCLDAADKLEMILYQYEAYQQFRFGL